jgi:hypothetical protein
MGIPIDSSCTLSNQLWFSSASEHHTLYQYNVVNADAVYIAGEFPPLPRFTLHEQIDFYA